MRLKEASELELSVTQIINGMTVQRQKESEGGSSDWDFAVLIVCCSVCCGYYFEKKNKGLNDLTIVKICKNDITTCINSNRMLF